MGKSCSFDEDAPDAVGEHGQGKGLDDWNSPIGIIVIAEEDAGKYHHRHADHVDECIADLCFGGVAGQEDTDPGKGNITCHKQDQESWDTALDGDPKSDPGKQSK